MGFHPERRISQAGMRDLLSQKCSKPRRVQAGFSTVDDFVGLREGPRGKRSSHCMVLIVPWLYPLKVFFSEEPILIIHPMDKIPFLHQRDIRGIMAGRPLCRYLLRMLHAC